MNDKFIQLPAAHVTTKSCVFAGQCTFFWLLLLLLLIAGSRPAYALCDGFGGSGGACGDGADVIYFTVNNGLVTITGISGYNGQELIIPTNGLPVVSIAPGAFIGSGVTKVVIPDTVTNIGDYAFSSCSNLRDVTLGHGVISIGRETFYFCTTLTSVLIPNSVTNIGILVLCLTNDWRYRFLSIV